MSDGIVHIHLDLLDDHPKNAAFGLDEEGLGELVASVADCGVLQPLLVRPKGNRYEIVSGHRRKRAARMAGLDTVPCRFLPDGVDDVVALVVTNFHRRDTPMARARAVRELKERLGIRRGGSRQAGANGNGCRLVELLNQPERTLRLYDKLNDLIPELQDCVERGVFGVKAGAQLASLPPQIQKALHAVLGDDIGDIHPEEVRRLREQSDRGYLVLEVLQQKLKELESELEARRQKDGQISDLEKRLAVLRAKKKELERDVIDRENAVRAIRERSQKSGAALYNLVERLARPIAAARPEIETLLERPLDAATASHILKWAQTMREVGTMLERAAGAACSAQDQKRKEPQLNAIQH